VQAPERDGEGKRVNERETARFRATTGTLQAFGANPREALAALMQRLPADAAVPIVIWPYNQGDTFFSESQHARVQVLTNSQETLTARERAGSRNWWPRRLTPPSLGRKRCKARTSRCSIPAEIAGTSIFGSSAKRANFTIGRPWAAPRCLA
jgi:hypothetical protein